MSHKVAFLGLGVMGYPMAGHLAKAGHEVRVYNRTPAKAEKWILEFGGAYAPSPEDAVAGAEFVFACVGNDDDVRQVTLGQSGAFGAMAPGSIFVDHTTTSARLAHELDAAAKSKEFGFLDAPISGGQAGAENGALTIMVGGASTDYDKAEGVMSCYARYVKRLGEAGAGQLTKMVNQICIAGVVQGLAEALHFAKHSDVDPRDVIDVISKGAAQSWQMENRYETMIDGEFEFGFAVDWMRKDLAICLDEARRNGAHLPLAALVDQFYAEVQSLGGSRWDTSSLIARLENAN